MTRTYVCVPLLVRGPAYRRIRSSSQVRFRLNWRSSPVWHGLHVRSKGEHGAIFLPGSGCSAAALGKMVSSGQGSSRPNIPWAEVVFLSGKIPTVSCFVNFNNFSCTNGTSASTSPSASLPNGKLRDISIIKDKDSIMILQNMGTKIDCPVVTSEIDIIYRVPAVDRAQTNSAARFVPQCRT